MAGNFGEVRAVGVGVARDAKDGDGIAVGQAVHVGRGDHDRRGVRGTRNVGPPIAVGRIGLDAMSWISPCRPLYWILIGKVGSLKRATSLVAGPPCRAAGPPCSGSTYAAPPMSMDEPAPRSWQPVRAGQMIGSVISMTPAGRITGWMVERSASRGADDGGVVDARFVAGVSRRV